MSYQVVPIPEGVSLGEETFKRSYTLVTKAWYEDLRGIAGFYLILTTPIFFFLWWQYQLSPPLALSVFGLVVYMVGFAADSLTTWQMFRLVPEYERRGVPFPLEEKNPFMKKEPTLWEQIVNLSTLFSLAIAVIAWIAPAIGIAGGVVHATAASNNRRQARRLNVQLRLLDLHSGKKAVRARNTLRVRSESEAHYRLAMLANLNP